MSSPQFKTESDCMLWSHSTDHKSLPGFRDFRLTRRGFLLSTLSAAALPTLTVNAVARTRATEPTQALSDTRTPAGVLNAVLEGNRRYLTRRRTDRDIRVRRASASDAERPPAAIFLTCAESGAPVETVCDLEMGDAWIVQMAGNILNEDVLGSLESAAVSAGAKLVMVMGHTSCGVIRAAIDHVRFGHVHSLLAKLDGAIASTELPGEKSGRNPAYVDAVAATHVRLTIDMIRARSPILCDLEIQGRIMIAGAMYDVASGRVTLV